MIPEQKDSTFDCTLIIHNEKNLSASNVVQLMCFLICLFT